MISYRDMTFCKYYIDCREGHKCLRALTLDVYKGAEKWWGGSDAPICVYDEYPECFIPYEGYDEDIPYRDENQEKWVDYTRKGVKVEKGKCYSKCDRGAIV